MDELFSKEIPDIDLPDVKQYRNLDIDEPLVSLKEYGFIVESQYYYQAIPGALEDCYVRKTVAEKLRLVEDNLPDGLRLKIYDAYRPVCVQKTLWDDYRAVVKSREPQITDEEEIDRLTAVFISRPSYDCKYPALHNSGGAVDLTLVTDKGYELNMGSHFDAFYDISWTAYFEKHHICPNARDNRRILYNAMVSQGFTNLPSEWWHFDYGTKFWAYFTGKDALYGSAEKGLRRD